MLADRPESDRGQLLIITALALAIVLVGLALVLNSAIYTANLSSRESTDSVEVTGAFGDTEGELETMIRYVNRHNNASSDAVNRAFDAAVSDLENETTDEYAKRGAAYDFEVVDRTNGTHLKHTNSSRSFVSGGTDPEKGNWTLAQNVPRVRGHTMTVAREDLHSTGIINSLDDFNDEGFYVRFEDNDGNAWEVYLLDDGTNVTVVGGDPDTLDNDTLGLEDLPMFDEEGCTVTAAQSEDVVINFTTGTVGRVGSTDRTNCPGLDFQSELTSELTIGHYNADDDSANDSRSGGTYELVIGTTTYEDQHFYDAGGGSPHATHIIYAARVESHYSRTDFTYSRAVRIHPGAETYVA